MPFPYADQTQINRVERLIFDLTEFMKPYEERDPEIKRMLPPYPDRNGHIRFPRFNMNMIYCGKQNTEGKWNIVCVHPVGIAALDPRFQEDGLRPSLITHPHDYDTLDVCGVSTLGHDRSSWRRMQIDDVWLAEYFGLGPMDWVSLVDGALYFSDFKVSSLFVGPRMVLKRLYRMTKRSHGLVYPDLEEDQPPDRDQAGSLSIPSS
jgi:hypothetical protein